MRHITLLTGGCRSGKSSHALALADALPGDRIFVATCPRLDDEMNDRIARHQQERAAGNWRTVEEQTDLVGVIERHVDVPVILVDCLTLWANNLLFHDDAMDEDAMARHAQKLVQASSSQEGHLLLVTNETGLGVVPENVLARRFRDLAGRMNAEIAALADKVILMVSGIPVSIKEK